jgi:hypothetical protein
VLALSALLRSLAHAVASSNVSDESLGPYRQPNLPDKLQQGVKAAIAAVPLVGGSAAELLDLVITPAVQKHQAAWPNELASVVETLKERGVDPPPDDGRNRHPKQTSTPTSQYDGLQRPRSRRTDARRSRSGSASRPSKPVGTVTPIMSDAVSSAVGHAYRDS